MKVLVTGARGQLGMDVMNELNKRGFQAVGVDIQEMDITHKAAVQQVLTEHCPDGVIHCAAWTAVDDAEAEGNLVKVQKINAEGTRYIAEACSDLNCKMLYISTDYVFNGLGERPWEPDDFREPLNIYGQTKYEGELAVEELVEKFFIVRISWVFGLHGKNFVKTMLDLAKKTTVLTVVNDQVGSPTYTYDLARLLVDMIGSDKYGKYHATNEGTCSWYEFACEIFRQAGELGHEACMNMQVHPVNSDAYPSKAKRPLNSRMDKSKLAANGFKELPLWQDALKRYLKELGY